MGEKYRIKGRRIRHQQQAEGDKGKGNGGRQPEPSAWKQPESLAYTYFITDPVPARELALCPSHKAIISANKKVLLEQRRRKIKEDLFLLHYVTSDFDGNTILFLYLMV